MAEFTINTSNVNGTASQLNSYASKLNSLSADVLRIRGSLSLKVAQTDNIKSRLKSVSDSLLTEKKGMTNMSNAIGQVVTEYKKAEMRVVTKAAGAKTVSILRESGLIPGSKSNSIALAAAIMGISSAKTGIWSKFKEWYSSITKHSSSSGSVSGGHSSGNGRHSSTVSSTKKGTTYAFTDASGNVKIFNSKDDYTNYLKQNGIYYVEDGKNVKTFETKEAYNQYLKEKNQYWYEDKNGNVSVYSSEADYKANCPAIAYNGHLSPADSNGISAGKVGKGLNLAEYSMVPGMSDQFVVSQKNVSSKSGFASGGCTSCTYWTIASAYKGSAAGAVDGSWTSGGAANDGSASNPATLQKCTGYSQADYMLNIMNNLQNGIPIGTRVNSQHSIACIGLKQGLDIDGYMSSLSGLDSGSAEYKSLIKEMASNILVSDSGVGKVRTLQDVINDYGKVTSSLWYPDGAPASFRDYF